tara:strand:- start:8182 stop:10521 length:2340 start_codon:yes stop_codon:yes gene_type:complete
MSNAIDIAKQNRSMLNELIKQTKDLAGMQEKAIRSQRKYTSAQKQLTESVKDNTEVNDKNDLSLDRRTKALSKSIEILNKAGKQFELLNIESYKLYTSSEQGGNIFEYLNLALTSVNEQVKIMGIEAGTARKVMYGFLPPGMFRMVNKLATGFRFLGAVTRKFSKNSKGETEQVDNLFTKIGSGIKVLAGYRKQSKLVSSGMEEMSETVKKIDFSEVDKEIKKQEGMHNLIGGYEPAPNKSTLAHKRKGKGETGEQEDFFSTALSASPEALLKNLETVEKAIKASKKKEFKEAKKQAKKEIRIQKTNLMFKNSSVKAAAKAEEVALKKVNKIEKGLRSQAAQTANLRIENQMKRQIEAEYKKKKLSDEQIKRMEYSTNLEVKRRTEAYRIGENTRDTYRNMAELDFKDLAKTSSELMAASDKLGKAEKATKDKKEISKAAQTQLDTLTGIKETLINDYQINTETVKQREKASKTADKARKKAFKQGEKAQKWRNIKTKMDNFRETKLKPLMSGLGAFLWGALKFIAIVIASLIVLQALWPTIERVFGPVFEVIKYGLGLVWEGIAQMLEGVMGLWDAITGGDFMDMLLALGDIIIGFGKIVWGLIVAVFGSLLTFIGGIAVGLFNKAVKWVKSLGNDVKSVGKIVGLVLAVAGMIIAWLYGAPILVVLAIGIALYKFGKWFIKKVEDFFFADGGKVESGMQVVGEKGPELVSLPKGSRVHSNKDSKKMISSSGGGVVNNINVTINATSTNDTELRRIAQKVGQMINREVNRTTSSSMSR